MKGRGSAALTVNFLTSDSSVVFLIRAFSKHRLCSITCHIKSLIDTELDL